MYRIVDAVADSINPAIAIVAIVAAVLEFRRNGVRKGLSFSAATMLGIAGIYVVAALDRAYGLWARYGGDYSLHTAFATTLVTSLFLWRPRWRMALVALWIAYMVLIPVMGYHSVVDVAIAVGVAVGVTVPWHVKEV